MTKEFHFPRASRYWDRIPAHKLDKEIYDLLDSTIDILSKANLKIPHLDELAVVAQQIWETVPFFRESARDAARNAGYPLFRQLLIAYFS